MKNPLPYDPRPSKAHPEHREFRKGIEKESPHFSWLPIGLLALMGVTLAMNIENDVKKCEERKDKESEKKGGSKQQHPRRRDERDRDRPRAADRGGYEGRDRSWERTTRAGDSRNYRDDCSCDGRSHSGRTYDDGPCSECDYEYRPRRRSREYRR